MEIKTIQRFVTVYDVISDCAPELLRIVSDEMKDALYNFDAYESMVHFVINGDQVISADRFNGDAGPAVSIKEFFFGCVQYCADLI